MQSAHVIRRFTGQTDWAAVTQLHGALAELTGSPVVEINRAVAIAECEGAAKGLEILDGVTAVPQPRKLPTVLGHARIYCNAVVPCTRPTQLTRKPLVWSWTRQCGATCCCSDTR